MKTYYYSEVLNKTFESEQACLEAEQKAKEQEEAAKKEEAEKKLAISKEKKILCAAIDEAESDIEKAYTEDIGNRV